MTPSFWPTLGLALGLALAIEGVFYAVAASHVAELLQRLNDLGPTRIRRMGLVTAALGLAWMVWLRFFVL